jgi:hypothetical protein
VLCLSVVVGFGLCVHDCDESEFMSLMHVFLEYIQVPTQVLDTFCICKPETD